VPVPLPFPSRSFSKRIEALNQIFDTTHIFTRFVSHTSCRIA
jgi:hypothetical protein